MLYVLKVILLRMIKERESVYVCGKRKKMYENIPFK